MENLIPQPENIIRGRGLYTIEGYNYPRVTSIIKVINKPALLQWYGKLGTENAMKYTEERADFGTALHDNIESLVPLEDNEINIDQLLARYRNEEMKGCMEGWLKWRTAKHFGQRQCEATLYSKKYGYAGTCDFYGYVDDCLFLLDWKTAKDVYLDYFLQMAAYAEAICELTGTYPERAGVVTVHGNSDYIYKWIGPDILRNFFTVFLSARTIYMWQNQGWDKYLHIEKLKEGRPWKWEPELDKIRTGSEFR